MAEEKQTPEIKDTLTEDDMHMLRVVLQDSHSRGVAPVSLYNPAEFLPEE